MCSTAKVYLEAPTFLPQLPSNLSNSGIPMIVCGLQALVQVPQHALHRRIYCRPQKVPHFKGPQLQDLVLSQKSRPKQKPGSPNPLWGCLPTPKMELPMTPQGDLSIFPSMLSVLYHSLRGIPSLWGYENLKITALSFISTGPDRCACKEPLAPSTWTKCSSRHLPRLSTMWKVKQDPFFCRLLRTSSSLFCRPSLGIWIPLVWWSRCFQSLHSSLGKAVKSDTFATKRFLPHQNSVKHKTELLVFVQHWS